MSDPRQTALRRAREHGCPYIHRSGAVLVLVKAIAVGGASGSIECKQATSSAAAREFVRRAVRESGWKTVSV